MENGKPISADIGHKKVKGVVISLLESWKTEIVSMIITDIEIHRSMAIPPGKEQIFSEKVRNMSLDSNIFFKSKFLSNHKLKSITATLIFRNLIVIRFFW